MFDGLPLADLTPIGILILIATAPYLQMARAKLIPVSLLEQAEARHQAQLEAAEARAKEWREAHMTSEAARQAAQEQSRELLELARTTAHNMNRLADRAIGGT